MSANDRAAAIFDKLKTAKPMATFGERIAEGRHVFILKEYGTRETTERGDIIAADFVVEESSTHKPGALVGAAWFISDRGWQGDREYSRASQFVRALIGTEDPAAAAESGSKLISKAQPGRGIRIVCTGVKRKTGYIEPVWEHLPNQTGAMIAAARTKLDAVTDPVAAPVAAPAPAPVSAPQTTGSLLGLL